MSKRLQELVAGISTKILGPADVSIEDVVFDSRQVRRGSLFVALRGVHQDGNQFIKNAVADGAIAVISEEPRTVPGTTVVVVDNALMALTQVALRFWENPSQKLLTIGVTGTNAKAT